MDYEGAYSKKLTQGLHSTLLLIWAMKGHCHRNEARIIIHYVATYMGQF